MGGRGRLSPRPSRSDGGACELALDAPACGFASPAAIEPLAFTVKDDVPVRREGEGCRMNEQRDKAKRRRCQPPNSCHHLPFSSPPALSPPSKNIVQKHRVIFTQ